MDSIGVFDEKQAKPTGYVKPFTGGADLDDGELLVMCDTSAEDELSDDESEP